MTRGMGLRFRVGDDVVSTDPDTGEWCRVRLTSTTDEGAVVGVVVRSGTVDDCRRGELWALPESWLTLLLESGVQAAGVTFAGAVMSWVTGIWMLTDDGLVPGLIVLGIAVLFTVAWITKTISVITAVRHAGAASRCGGVDDANADAGREVEPIPATGR
ncbi:hypothetical protein [Actinophytocola sp.]|uniref:hypothetical protein n=1 Tax=Actinophytocola sp. TaxID=1872138 RepID=UPI002ED0464B